MRPPDHTSRQRGTYRVDRGTPDAVLDYVRRLGHITHDLASSREANRRVNAAYYWDVDDPCPSQVPYLEPRSVVYCNPPGPAKAVRQFWDVWLDCLVRGAEGAFLIFKQDHWRQLLAPPFELPCIVLRKRLAFVDDLSGQSLPGASFPSTLVLSKLPPGPHPGHVVYWR